MGFQIKLIGKRPNLPTKTYQLSNFLTVYFNFAYYLFCSPFRFVTDGNRDWYKISTNFLHKVVCGFLTLIGVLHMLSEFKTSLPTLIRNQSPLKYFQFLRTFFAFSFQTLTLKRFWLNQDELLYLVNSTKIQCQMLPKRKLKVLHKSFSRLICFLFAVMALYEIILKKVLASPESWREKILNRNLVSEGHFMLFLSDNASFEHPNIKNQYLSIWDYCLAVLVAIGWIERYLIGYYMDLSLLLTVFTVWSIARTFAKNLEADIKNDLRKLNTWELFESAQIASLIALPGQIKQSTEGSRKCQWEEVYQSYENIRGYFQIINSFWGKLITIYLADAIMFYALSVDMVFVSTDITTTIRLLFFISNSTCFCILSADACHQFDALKMWLTNEENRRDIPMDQLNIILNELHNRTVGIRGSDIFTITYSLLWNVMTTVVTYFIICLQTRLQETHMQREIAAHTTLANCTSLLKL